MIALYRFTDVSHLCCPCLSFTSFHKESYEHEIDGHAYCIHGYWCPHLVDANKHEEVEASCLQCPVDNMTESKPSSFFHTGFHFECKEGGHEIVGHETDDISYGPCQRYADIPNQHPIDGIMHSRGHYSGHYKSERFLILFFYCHVNVHNSMQI